MTSHHYTTLPPQSPKTGVHCAPLPLLWYLLLGSISLHLQRRVSTTAHSLGTRRYSGMRSLQLEQGSSWNTLGDHTVECHVVLINQGGKTHSGTKMAILLPEKRNQVTKKWENVKQIYIYIYNFNSDGQIRFISYHQTVWNK